MSSLTKAFKKTVKKVKKSTKKAVNKVADTTKDVADKTANVAKDTANKTANAVTGAANTVAHEVERGATDLTREFEKISDDLGQVAEKAYRDALEAGESAWNEVVELSERWLTDALTELVVKVAEGIYRDHLALIESLFKAGHGLMEDPRSRKELERLFKHAASKKQDSESDKTVSSLAKSQDMNRSNEKAKKEGFGSMSFGFGGSLAYGAGGEGCYGFAFGLPDTSKIQGFFGMGGVVGSVGGSGSLQIGVWFDEPKKLEGPYLAVGLEFETDVGGGIQIIFAMPKSEKEWLSMDFKLAGIVVCVGGGGEASVAVSSGYTWTF
jgi:gas vesicle protein